MCGKGAFERSRYMNMVVQRACHPQLRYYLHSTVSGLFPFLQKVGLVGNVVFCCCIQLVNVVEVVDDCLLWN